MEEMKNKIEGIKGASLISEGERAALKRQTAFSLPNSPAARGMRADAVKPAFWRGLVDEGISMVTFFNRLVEEVNGDFGKLKDVLIEILSSVSKDAKESTLVMRDETGGVLVADAKEDGHAVNRRVARQMIASIPNASDVRNGGSGLMTNRQAGELETLVALLEDPENNQTVVDTIREVLEIFEEYPEGCSVVQALADKLDLVPENQSDEPLVYAVDENGAQTMLSVSQKGIATSIARRDSQGRITGAYPSSDNHLTTRKYVKDVIGQAEQRMDRFEQRMTEFENEFMSGEFSEDDTVAHQKEVPTSSYPFASVAKIFGSSRECRNLLSVSWWEWGEDVQDGALTIVHDENDPSIITVSGTSGDDNSFDGRYCVAVISSLFSSMYGEYSISGCPKNSQGVELVFESVDFEGKTVSCSDDGEGGTFTHDISDDAVSKLYIKVPNGTTVENLVFKIMVNFGSVREHEPPFDGYKSFPVSKVVSKSANLFDIDNPNIKVKQSADLKYVPKIEDGVIYSGGKHASSNGGGFVVDVRGLTRVRISHDASYADTETVRVMSWYRVDAHKEDGSISVTVLSSTNVKEKTAIWVDVSSFDELFITWHSTTKYGIEITNLMVSAEDVPYQPYGIIDTLTIPGEVQALEGYGQSSPVYLVWGSPNDVIRNYLDLERRVFVCFGRINGGSWEEYDHAKEIDVSQYFSAFDKYIKVVAGGKLVFETEWDEPVSSTVRYQLEV